MKVQCDLRCAFFIFVAMNYQSILQQLGVSPLNPSFFIGSQSGGSSEQLIKSISPIDQAVLAEVRQASAADYEHVISAAQKAFLQWKKIPAPQRGEIIRQVGEGLRAKKEALGALVTMEMGKTLQEGLGEVQEMIDVCDFAVGLSRQLYGLTMHSERPNHRMYEQYHPAGVVGVISAFNFPVAVWSWNAMIAAVCGDVIIWKPSEKTPLTAQACQNVVNEVFEKNNMPNGVFNLIQGDAQVGRLMAEDKRVPLLSATGSTAMGKDVATKVAGRLGKSLLELGGNNAVIITENANLKLALRAVVFGAVGTCGQRCTSTRRLIVHSSMYDEVKSKLIAAYKTLPIGNPLDQSNLVGPLIDQASVDNYFKTIKEVQEQGGNLLVGGELVSQEPNQSFYVLPTIIEAENSFAKVQDETFAPILYLLKYEGTIEDAIEIQNDVRQGLSSSIFSENIRETELFLSNEGSDCGISNVNIGTSGAEIGGAFGGEKDTGGGRESGSDAWKFYMRRQTNTINYSAELPLAQGIKFDI